MNLNNHVNDKNDPQDGYFVELGISKERYKSLIDGIANAATEVVESEEEIIDTEFIKLALNNTKPTSIEEAMVVGWLAKDCMESIMELVTSLENDEEDLEPNEV
jgi:hypothetical protein